MAADNSGGLLVGSQRVCGVALLDLPDGTRTLANTLDQALMDRLESEECCHRVARLAGGRFSLD